MPPNGAGRASSYAPQRLPPSAYPAHRHHHHTLFGPPRQAAFDALKAEHGSTFAWHGSAPENWHAILRSGLKNASNTKLMTAGAAYGAGIYLSTDARLSMHYAQMHHGHGGAGSGTATNGASSSSSSSSSSNAFLAAGANLKILALCEVAEVPTLHKAHSIWVAPNESSVVTRFLFAFPTGIQAEGAHSVPGDSTASDFVNQVRACLQKLSDGPA
jgi:poly [ADP-ribose] polymerase 6/8